MAKNGIPLFCFPPQQVFSRCIPMLTCLQQPPHQFFYPPIKIISPFLHRTSSLDPSPLAWSRQIHNPGARKKQHKETLAIPHNFYGNLVELEHMVKSELPVGVVLLINAKWTKTPTLWDALDYKKTGKCRIFYRHICIQDKYAIQEFVWIFKKKIETFSQR